MKKTDLVGSWRLVRHGQINLENKFVSTSDFLEGQLIYGIDGSMSVLIVMRDEAKNLEDIIVYSGTFSISENIIKHHVRVSPRKARRNTTEERLASLTENTLVLTTALEEGSYYHITWEKLEPGDKIL